MSNRNNNQSEWNLFITNFKLSNKSSIPRIFASLVAKHSNINLNSDLESDNSSFTYIGPPQLNSPGFLIKMPQNLIDQIMNFNGTFIFNQPIWIVKSPGNYFSYFNIFNQIFIETINEGTVDLSDMNQKLLEKGISSEELITFDFNNDDFIEFLLFFLGSFSRDSYFLVNSLILQNNNIKIITESMKRIIMFLPALRYLDLSQNPISPSKNNEIQFLIVNYGSGQKTSFIENNSRNNNVDDDFRFNESDTNNNDSDDENNFNKGNSFQKRRGNTYNRRGNYRKRF